MSATEMLSCSRCGTSVPASLEKCSVCGASLASAIPLAQVAVAPAEPVSSNFQSLADKPWLVLATIFLVTAAFGIPLIWMCRAWSDTTKAILTLVTIVYTIFILWLFYLAMAWCWGRISDSF